MKICHVCSATCEDSAELCPLCGAEFLNEEQNEVNADTEIIIENPVLAASVEDIVTAEIYCDMLKENEIPYTTDEADMSSVHLLFGGEFDTIDIYVSKENLAKAKDIYQSALEVEPTFEEFEEEE